MIERINLNSIIRRAKNEYYKEDSDYRRRMTPLSQALSYASQPLILLSTLTELISSHSFIEYAYLHNNGFYVIYLANPDLGLQLRMHVWMPQSPRQHEQPHRHRMGFISTVLAGELKSTLFERIAPPLDLSDTTQLFQEFVIGGPAHGNFDVTETSFSLGSTVTLRPLNQLTHKAGETYLFQASDIHRVNTSQNLSAPVITLTIWEPAFQPSIAYEPLASEYISQTNMVHRLDSPKYEEILSLAIHTMESIE